MIMAAKGRRRGEGSSWRCCLHCMILVIFPPQVCHLLSAVDFDHPNMKAVQVSTVDAFQGAEKEIIILSCVRTRQVGFIDSEKRMNVALTRGRRHLLIVGNLACLRKNRLWGRVIQHCEGKTKMYLIHTFWIKTDFCVSAWGVLGRNYAEFATVGDEWNDEMDTTVKHSCLMFCIFLREGRWIATCKPVWTTTGSSP